MTRARVLVVDDSVVVRRLVSGVLAEDPRIEVVGTAPNGRIALAKIRQHHPDLVVLDIEMPEMDGLTTLAHIKVDHPEVAVVMFSILTERGAARTLDALTLGAVDYVTKPKNQADGLRTVREELAPKVVALCTRERAARPVVERPSRTVLASPEAPAVVAIGASTGGPDALTRLLARLPKTFPLPVLVVQHMPAVFTRLFAKRLDARVPLPVAEARAGTRIEGGAIWIAPGGYHLVVGNGLLRTPKTPPLNSCRPAADALFRSVAQNFGPSAVALVLSGMGRDGLQGARDIHERGGRILAQEQESCAVWGMPRHVVEAGLASVIGTPEELADAVVALTRVVHG